MGLAFPGGVDIGEAGTFWILVVQDFKLVIIEDDTDGATWTYGIGNNGRGTKMIPLMDQQNWGLYQNKDEEKTCNQTIIHCIIRNDFVSG